ncbi:MAG: Rid family hydrolase [Opitutales bacterium]|nr:Rid family hydrolase [Opitutales bacterium]NRA27396.1 hypothetical protein [Opitutales bacterium]
MRVLPDHKLSIVLVFFALVVSVRYFLGGVVTNWNEKIEVVEKPDRPYASHVVVEPGAGYFYTWGITASPRSKTVALKGLPDEERYGDTYTQSHRVLTTLTSDLKQVGLTLRDVVNVRAYVVGNDEEPPDFDGWNRAFTEFFGTPDNPHKPARTTVGISRLFISQYKIEVEFVAVFPEGRGPFAEGTRHWLDWERSGRHVYETREIWKSYGRPGFPMSTGKAVDEGQGYFYSSAFLPDTKFPMPPGMPVNPMMFGSFSDQAASILKKMNTAFRSGGVSYEDIFFVRTIMFPEKGRPIGPNFGRFGREYVKYFTNDSNPNKPTRTVMSAPGYASMGPLMSLEMYGALPDDFDAFEEGAHIAILGKPDAISAPAVGVSPDANKVWFSGVIAPTEGSLTEEFNAVWTATMEALDAAGATFEDMVHTRIYLETTHVKNDTDALKKALETVIKASGSIHRPALTVLPIVDLPGGARIEIETMAGVRP